MCSLHSYDSWQLLPSNNVQNSDSQKRPEFLELFSVHKFSTRTGTYQGNVPTRTPCGTNYNCGGSGCSGRLPEMLIGEPSRVCSSLGRVLFTAAPAGGLFLYRGFKFVWLFLAQCVCAAVRVCQYEISCTFKFAVQDAIKTPQAKAPQPRDTFAMNPGKSENAWFLRGTHPGGWAPFEFLKMHLYQYTQKIEHCSKK